jgi:hypothetical protein
MSRWPALTGRARRSHRMSNPGKHDNGASLVQHRSGHWNRRFWSGGQLAALLLDRSQNGICTRQRGACACDADGCDGGYCCLAWPGTILRPCNGRNGQMRSVGVPASGDGRAREWALIAAVCCVLACVHISRPEPPAGTQCMSPETSVSRECRRHRKETSRGVAADKTLAGTVMTPLRRSGWAVAQL